MAINFLDNVQFNKNQLLGARIENVTSDPSSANGGDIIFNSTSNKLKYYDGTTPFNASGWISLPDGIGIGGSGTVGTIPVFNSTNEITDSRLETTGSGSTQTFTFNSDGDVATKGSFSLLSAGGIKDKDGDLGTSGQLLSSTGTQINWIAAPVSYSKWILDADSGGTQNIIDNTTVVVQGGTGISTATSSGGATDKKVTITNSSPFNSITLASTTGSNSTILNSGTITLAAGAGITTTNNSSGQVTIAATNAGTMSSFILSGDAGANQTISDGNTLKVAGGSNITTVASATDIVTVNLNSTVNIGTLNVSDTGQNSFTGQVTIPALPAASTDAASKAYVDASVVGGLTVKGGFNANTGAIIAGGQLFDSATRVAIAVGDYYIATVAGNFFGQASTPLTPGDSVLVQTAAAVGASSITDFAVIQSDTDVATISTVGIGNTNIEGAGNKDGLSLVYSGSGTAKLGLDIISLPFSGAVSTTDPATVEFAVYNDEGGANQKMTLAQIQQGISASATSNLTAASTVVTHNLGTRNVIVQLYDIVTNDTVYGDVSRTSTNTITVAFASTPTNTIRCMIYSVDIQGV